MVCRGWTIREWSIPVAGIYAPLREDRSRLHFGPLSALALSAMERVPQVLENVTLAARRPLEEMKTMNAASDHVKKALGNNGRVLIRWSGTEPKLRIMLEGPNEDQLQIWAKELAGAAKKDTRPLEA